MVERRVLTLVWVCGIVLLASILPVFGGISVTSSTDTYVEVWWTHNGSRTMYQADGSPLTAGVEKVFDGPPTEAMTESGMLAVTDYEVEMWNGTKIKAANIAKTSDSDPWEWKTLVDIHHIPYGFSSLLPTGGGALYTGVVLGSFQANNPLWKVTAGQTVSVNNGQITSVKGIYWSTTPFTFDANSETGLVGTWFTGQAEASAYITNIPVPEPSSLLALGGGLVGMLGIMRRRR